MKTIEKYLPENLDLDQIIENNPPNFKEFRKDKAIYILSLLYEIPAANRKQSRKYHIVRINAKTIQRQGIDHFPKYVDWLMYCKIIGRDASYVIGSESRKYWFTSKYRTTVRIIELTDRGFIRAIKKRQRIKAQERSKYPKLRTWLEQIEIDAQAAYAFIEERLKIDLEKGDKKAIGRFNHVKVCIRKLERREFSFSVDGKAGRLHTNLTNLQKEIRNFITFKGRRLVSLDLKNSQPYLLLLIFDPEFWFFPMAAERNETKLLVKANFLKNLIIRSKNFYHEYPTELMKNTGIRLQRRYYPELLDFRRLVRTGLIYEEIQKMSEVPIDRNQAKKKLLIDLFDDNKHYIGKTKFGQAFPNMLKMTNFIKHPNRKNLPLLLQKIESQLILEIICRRITRESPKIPLLTIHDSIITTEEYKDHVLGILRAESWSLVACSPIVDEQHWAPENAKNALIKIEQGGA